MSSESALHDQSREALVRAVHGSQGPGALGLSQPTEIDQRPDSRDWPEARGAVQARFYWGSAAAEGSEE